MKKKHQLWSIEPAWPSLAVLEGHRVVPAHGSGLGRTDLWTGIREEVGAEKNFTKVIAVNSVEIMSRD